jgi:5-(carboxyamino)imidazole ribonucleotide synthase
MVLLPGSTIGIVGGGQLGRMLVLVARRMGYRTVVLDPDEYAPAGQISDEHIVASLFDLAAARQLAQQSDVVTLEWENADLNALQELAKWVPVRPGPHVLEVAQNRLAEKEAARRLGLPTARFHQVRALSELEKALAEFGYPAVLKTATGGYDGRGQRVIKSHSDAAPALEEISAAGTDIIIEEWVPFRLEVSAICARSEDGRIASFPVGENIHERGILDFTLIPARISESVRTEVIRISERLIEGLDVIGILAVELFVDESGRVLVNEIAPRPHNSGHYSWEACSVSQFEQQLRAVAGLPLAEPVLLRPAAMVNLLGEHLGPEPDYAGLPASLSTPSLSLHLYGKRESRPGRKMGHMTVLADDVESAYRRVSEARNQLVRPR